MGAAESVVRNVDKRTARRENRKAFIEGIAQFRAQHQLLQGENANQGPEASSDAGSARDVQNAANHTNDEDQMVRVFVRKRPIFPHELEQKEFDVISSDKTHGELFVHDARMEADMKGRFLNHHKFTFSEVFSENDDSDKVYDNVIQPLVRLTRQGGNGTALMYGQTGSGKSYTMSHIYYRSAWALFEGSATEDENDRGPAIRRAWVSFVELTGDTCADVLNGNQKLQLLTCPNGDVITFPAVQVEVSSPQELHDCIKFACSLRATAATGVHDQSSRSHALCRVELEGGNALTMVDLAGSEHRIDSADHDAQRRKESAQINSSLMKLKECIRARARNADYIPYRQSKLTHLLRPSFVEDPNTKSRTVIIATVSPSSKDTEHSLNTLRHSCIMDGQDPQDGETRWVSGGTTVRQNLPPVDVTMLARQRKARQSRGEVPSEGPSWGSAPSKHHSRDGSFDNVAKAASQKKALALKERKRRQAENAARKTLSAAALEKLEIARSHCGYRQRERMNRLQFEAKEKARLEMEAPQKTDSKSYKLPKIPSNRLGSASSKNKPTAPSSGRSRPSPREPVQSVGILAPNNASRSNVEIRVRSPPLDAVPSLAQVQRSRKSKPAAAASPIDLDALRAKVWNDPNVPDDQKEEYIVMLIKQARERRSTTGNAVSHNPKSQHNSALPAPNTASNSQSLVAQKPMSRHEKVQQARLRMIEKEQSLARRKLDRKMEAHAHVATTSSTASVSSNNMDELRAEIGRLHSQLQQETDQVTKFALKQQYSRTKATLMRFERQKKQAVAMESPSRASAQQPLESISPRTLE
mmetsp:Transcript_2379/g.5492  ORF Transcript_2379/g.5492 Transcript_2379/m.5492 type:complete len:813 (+) Transcript_2379:158-2596(+)|eukprot:CAMPEP_0171542468 /NCGR_PEP_ID=MMETSP0960-20121227/2378_1 /TAXON_ID=87120 /ORGANISM="Aurantiochytrium limacinum, Strain ATCCMYA-1381" /LENGTH=812 /DNA_ID=CAMNT_0012090001 /DNA_START=161 /DNA_END=2599 /DNA_ORIENTATION=-